MKQEAKTDRGVIEKQGSGEDAETVASFVGTDKVSVIVPNNIREARPQKVWFVKPTETGWVTAGELVLISAEG